jgi:hypothetical protein
MTFPTANVSISNLDNASDDPSQARADLLDAVNKLNLIITEQNTAGGVVTLDGSGYIATARIPSTISAGGTQTISPSTGIVNIQSIIRLPSQTATTIKAVSSPQQGDIAFCSNVGAVSTPGLAIYSGTAWRGLALTANVFINL